MNTAIVSDEAHNRRVTQRYGTFHTYGKRQCEIGDDCVDWTECVHRLQEFK